MGFVGRWQFRDGHTKFFVGIADILKAIDTLHFAALLRAVRPFRFESAVPICCHVFPCCSCSGRLLGVCLRPLNCQIFAKWTAYCISLVFAVFAKTFGESQFCRFCKMGEPKHCNRLARSDIENVRGRRRRYVDSLGAANASMIFDVSIPEISSHKRINYVTQKQVTRYADVTNATKGPKRTRSSFRAIRPRPYRNCSTFLRADEVLATRTTNLNLLYAMCPPFTST
jgi:hypothetical protein